VKGATSAAAVFAAAPFAVIVDVSSAHAFEAG
jgi:hypothetical protein